MRLLTVPALLALALLAPLAFAADVTFDATAEARFTFFRGSHGSGVIEKGESNLGDFTGTFERKVTKKNSLVKGTARLVFESGDTLEFSFHVVRAPGTSFFSGTFTITGGTGGLAGATGEGALFYDVTTSPIPVVWVGN